MLSIQRKAFFVILILSASVGSFGVWFIDPVEVTFYLHFSYGSTVNASLRVDDVPLIVLVDHQFGLPPYTRGYSLDLSKGAHGVMVDHNGSALPPVGLDVWGRSYVIVSVYGAGISLRISGQVPDFP